MKPESSFHVIANLDVTTPPKECARYLDAYAASEPKAAVIFIGMNEFTTNPDRWYCDAFGFDEHGGMDDFAWLANTRTSASDGASAP